MRGVMVGVLGSEAGGRYLMKTAVVGSMKVEIWGNEGAWYQAGNAGKGGWGVCMIDHHKDLYQAHCVR